MRDNPTSLTRIHTVVFLAVGAMLFAPSAFAGEQKSGNALDPATHRQGAMTGEMIDQMRAMMAEWRGPRLVMPIMNSARGRKLFASKGCVTCHSINGVGGEDAPNLDAHMMMPFMNPFEFAARMWRGAATMIALQEDAMGYQIEFTGEELADIIAFVHDEDEQHKFSEADIPSEIMPLMNHMHGEPGGGAAAHGEDLGHKHGAEEEQHTD